MRTINQTVQWIFIKFDTTVSSGRKKKYISILLGGSPSFNITLDSFCKVLVENRFVKGKRTLKSIDMETRYIVKILNLTKDLIFS